MYSLVMMSLSNKTLAKIIIINALVCKNQPIMMLHLFPNPECALQDASPIVFQQ